MLATIINGKTISTEIKDEVRDEVSRLAAGGGGVPQLAVILVGNDSASATYVRNKKRACEYTGIKSLSYELDEKTSEEELLFLIAQLNAKENVSGILVQLPLPPHINESRVLLAIDPKKDVDCFHPYNVGLLNIGKPSMMPCTPAGIIELIKRGVGVDAISGKECVVIGRSNIVGKPMSALLLLENGTVTTCHSRTSNLTEVTRRADILVAAVGRPEFVTADMVKQGAIVIDVGIHHVDGHLTGDVKFDEVSEVAGYTTPVPGGVGPMTIAMLMKNCLNAYKTGGNI